MEKEEYLSEQIITYLGNKRSLLNFIETPLKTIKRDLKKRKLSIFDVFAGSGIVSRFFKQHSSILYANDLEKYSYLINKCYLTNKEDVNEEILNHYYEILQKETKAGKLCQDGFIYNLYSPKDDENIKKNERVFYTTRNAQYIDTARKVIETFEEPYKTLFLGPLLYEASTKTNTSGVFKGFYKNSKTNIGQFGGDDKNCLKRIKANIKVQKPVLSNYSCRHFVYNEDANIICKELPHVDLAYLDPPYNQHPYGSNYFMLNLIADYKEPKDISHVSGIPSNWKKSAYNKKQSALDALFDLCKNIDATYLLISYNSEGIISIKDMKNMLSSLGEVLIYKQEYNVYRGCKNLNNRNIYVDEYLFLVRKI